MAILVVDDIPEIVRALERRLRRDYDVRTAFSIASALERLSAAIPDILLCDYLLGDESGLDLMRAVAESHPNMRRVLMSSSAVETFVEPLATGLIHAVVPKPWTVETLLRALFPAWVAPTGAGR